MRTAYTDAGTVHYWSATIKVRKIHRCFGCGRMIQPGETCHTETQLCDGAFERMYTCPDCVAWIEAHPGYFNEDMWGEGDIATARAEEARGR